jgi:anti-sigma factor RsiW
MTDSEEPIDPAAHKVADVLLPWFVNGTLASDERVFVEAHLQDCAQCRREVAWLRDLRTACVTASESSTAAAPAARRLRRNLDARGPLARRQQPEWRWALVGAFAAVIAVGTAWIATSEDDARYRTLGVHEAAAPRSGTVVVVFDPATTELELRRIVRAAGARIVDGPTQSNAYVLDVPPAQAQGVLKSLKAERAVVLAERLDSGASR